MALMSSVWVWSRAAGGTSWRPTSLTFLLLLLLLWPRPLLVLLLLLLWSRPLVFLLLLAGSTTAMMTKSSSNSTKRCSSYSSLSPTWPMAPTWKSIGKKDKGELGKDFRREPAMPRAVAAAFPLSPLIQAIRYGHWTNIDVGDVIWFLAWAKSPLTIVAPRALARASTTTQQHNTKALHQQRTKTQQQDDSKRTQGVSTKSPWGKRSTSSLGKCLLVHFCSTWQSQSQLSAQGFGFEWLWPWWYEWWYEVPGGGDKNFIWSGLHQD